MRNNNIKNAGNLYNKSEIDNFVQEINKKLDDKVDKEEGKGLSTNDYTDEDKDKLNSSFKKEIEFSTYLAFPNVGEENVLYIDKDKKKSYIWDATSQTYTLLDEDEVDFDVIQVVL